MTVHPGFGGQSLIAADVKADNRKLMSTEAFSKAVTQDHFEPGFGPIDANVFEKDLDRVRLGQGAKVSVPAIPGVVFSGKVIFVSSVVDPETHTVKVRTEAANRDGKLKPDMFANVQIITDADRSAISVPQSAVLNDGGQSVVFVITAGGPEKRVVSTGILSDDRIEIREGVKAGEKVVVKGNYLLLEQSKAAR